MKLLQEISGSCFQNAQYYFSRKMLQNVRTMKTLFSHLIFIKVKIKYIELVRKDIKK